MIGWRKRKKKTTFLPLLIPFWFPELQLKRTAYIFGFLAASQFKLITCNTCNEQNQQPPLTSHQHDETEHTSTSFPGTITSHQFKSNTSNNSFVFCLRPGTDATTVAQSILYSLPYFFLQVFATTLVSFASSSGDCRMQKQPSSCSSRVGFAG
jgi:hypothetical protein